MKQLIAYTAAAAALVGIGAFGGYQAQTSEDPATQPIYAPLSAGGCTATGPTAFTYDPCTIGPDHYKTEFRTNLLAMQYFPTWKKYNKVEWAALLAYNQSAEAWNVAPRPTIKTKFGKIILDAMYSCKAWAINPAECGTP